MWKFKLGRVGLFGLALGLFSTALIAGNRVCFEQEVMLPFEIDGYGNIECRGHDHEEEQIEEHGGPPSYGIAKICFNTRTDRMSAHVRGYIENENEVKICLKNDPEVEACVEDEIAREIHHYLHGGEGHGGGHVATLHDDGESGDDHGDGKGRTTVDIARSLLKVSPLGHLKFCAKGEVTIGERGPGGGGGGGGGGSH